jgi:hypothetical protein
VCCVRSGLSGFSDRAKWWKSWLGNLDSNQD